MVKKKMKTKPSGLVEEEASVGLCCLEEYGLNVIHAVIHRQNRK